jgi:hypothetical protein
MHPRSPCGWFGNLQGAKPFFFSLVGWPNLPRRALGWFRPIFFLGVASNQPWGGLSYPSFFFNQKKKELKVFFYYFKFLNFFFNF